MPPVDDLQLETARLILRPPRLEDLDAWTEMMADEETARFIGGVAARPACWRQLMTMIGSWHAHGFAMFSVIEKARWTLARTCRPVAAGGMAGYRDRLVDRSRQLGEGATRSKPRSHRLIGQSTRSGGPTSSTRSHPRTSHRNASRRNSVRAIVVPASCHRRSRTQRSTSGARRARSGCVESDRSAQGDAERHRP